MTYDELKDLVRNLKFQFYGENDAARREAERLGMPRPAPRSLYDFIAHRHGWRYVLTAHGVSRADLDGYG